MLQEMMGTIELLSNKYYSVSAILILHVFVQYTRYNFVYGAVNVIYSVCLSGIYVYKRENIAYWRLRNTLI